jgi:hypothetical protein
MPLTDGLDSGPPLPPGMTAQRPPATVSQMAGSQGQSQPGQAPAQSQGLQQSVIQDFMLAEKALQSAASKLPQFAPIADQLIQQLRAQGGSVLQSAAQPSGAPSSPMQSMLGSLGSAPQM